MTGKEAIKLLKGYNISDVYDTKIPYSDKDGFFTMRECVETVDKELTKYKRALGIFERLLNDKFVYGGFEDGRLLIDGSIYITDEEEELLEELMKSE